MERQRHVLNMHIIINNKVFIEWYVFYLDIYNKDNNNNIKDNNKDKNNNKNT